MECAAEARDEPGVTPFDAEGTPRGSETATLAMPTRLMPREHSTTVLRRRRDVALRSRWRRTVFTFALGTLMGAGLFKAEPPIKRSAASTVTSERPLRTRNVPPADTLSASAAPRVEALLSSERLRRDAIDFPVCDAMAVISSAPGASGETVSPTANVLAPIVQDEPKRETRGRRSERPSVDFRYLRAAGVDTSIRLVRPLELEPFARGFSPLRLTSPDLLLRAPSTSTGRVDTARNDWRAGTVLPHSGG